MVVLSICYGSTITKLMVISDLNMLECNDPYQIIQVFSFNKFDQPIVGGAKLTFSRMNNFGLTKTQFRRPRRYEFTDRLNVKIRFTDKKLWSW